MQKAISLLYNIYVMVCIVSIIWIAERVCIQKEEREYKQVYALTNRVREYSNFVIGFYQT